MIKGPARKHALELACTLHVSYSHAVRATDEQVVRTAKAFEEFLTRPDEA